MVGDDIESLKARLKFVDFRVDDRLGLLCFLLAIGDVAGDGLLEVVNVVNEKFHRPC